MEPIPASHVSSPCCGRSLSGRALGVWWLWRGLLLALVLLMSPPATPAGAQIPGLSPAEPEETVEEPVPEPEPEVTVVLPYSLAEAPERLTEHRQLLATTLQLIDDISLDERLGEKLIPIAADLRQIRRGLIHIERMSNVRLRSQRDRSRYHMRVLNEFQRRLARRLGAMEEQRALINETLARWDQTETAFGEDLPQSLANGLATYRAEASLALERIRSAIDGTLVIQHRNQTVIDGFESVVGRIDQATAQQVIGMFTIDQAPLWAGPAGHVALTESDTVGRQIRNVGEQLANFAAEFRVNLLVHGLATLLLVGLLVHFRHRLHHSADAPRMANGVASILERPFSSALLVMLLGTAWFYPYVPPSVSYLSSAILCLPLLRLLPRLVSPTVRPPIVIFIALGVVDSLAIAMLGHTFAGRAVQASLMLPLAIVVAWGGKRAVEAARRTKPKTIILIRAVVWPAVLMFVACSIATLVGYLQLATFLYHLAFTASLAALLFFALTKVLSGGLVMLLQSSPAQAIGSVQNNQMRLLRSGLKLIKFAAAVAWLATVLSEAGLLPGVIGGISAVLNHSYAIGTLNVSLGRVLAFALTLWIAIYLARILTAVLDNDVLPRMELGRGVPGAVSKLTQYFILSIGILLALAAAGLELQNLALLATAFSIGIGFGLQTLVNNFVSGLILIFERPVQIGDVVEVSGKMGEVRRIGIRSSTVRLFDGAELVVPNGNLISNDLINWTLSDKFRRIEILVGVAYGSDLRKTKEILQSCAASHPDIADTPPPGAVFMEFADSSVDFALRCWTIHSERVVGIRSDLAIQISESFAEAGIEIPFPQRDLHLKTGAQGAQEAGEGGGEGGAMPADSIRNSPGGAQSPPDRANPSDMSDMSDVSDLSDPAEQP